MEKKSDIIENFKTAIGSTVKSLSNSENVEVSFLLTEQLDGSFRINFRSKGRYIINDIASELGGGGHKFAAGCRIVNSNAIEIEEKIVNLLKLKIGKDGNKE